MSYDRDLLLERTDLRALADELLGEHKGRVCTRRGRVLRPPTSADRTHSTGEHLHRPEWYPTMALPRVRCRRHRSGLRHVVEGLRVREALAFLARRAGIDATSADHCGLSRKFADNQSMLCPFVRTGRARAYVDACKQFLWSPAGARWRGWLAARSLPDAVLRAKSRRR